jgi:hypothetical protein
MNTAAAAMGMPLEAFLYATFDRDLDVNKVKVFKDSKELRENRVGVLLS